MAQQSRPLPKIVLILSVAFTIYSIANRDPDARVQFNMKSALATLSHTLMKEGFVKYEQEFQEIKKNLPSGSPEEVNNYLESALSRSSYETLAVLESEGATVVSSFTQLDLNAASSRQIRSLGERSGQLQWDAQAQRLKKLYLTSLEKQESALLGMVDIRTLRQHIFGQSFICLLVNPKGLVVASNVIDLEHNVMQSVYSSNASDIRSSVSYPKELPGRLSIDLDQREINYGMPRYKVHRFMLPNQWYLFGLEKLSK